MYSIKGKDGTYIKKKKRQRGDEDWDPSETTNCFPFLGQNVGGLVVSQIFGCLWIFFSVACGFSRRYNNVHN